MGKFILSAKHGEYQFYFTTDNGDRIACSISHITKSAAWHALDETRRVAGSDLYVKKQSDDRYYFQLFNESGVLLITSEKFGSPECRDYAITIIKREAETAAFSEAF